MKKITLIMALLCAISLFAQKHIPARIDELNKVNTVFKPVQPLTLNNQRNQTADAVVNNATYAKLNAALATEIATNKYPYLELSIPYNGATVTMQLYRTEVTTQDFHVDTDKRKNAVYAGGAYYRGIIKGNNASVAAFSFFNNSMTGIVSASGFQNLVVGKLKTAGNTNDYIIYSDAEMNVRSNFECKADETKILPGFQPSTVGREVQTTHCVTVYFEIDYTLYQENNSSVTEATDWITAIFNNVQTLYDNDGITVAIKSVFVWTEQDPYTGTGSSDYLYMFYANRPSFDGDAAMLVGDDEGGLGGVAISIGGLCSNQNVSYADVDYWYQNVPIFSWDVEVITHELGHLFGSPHTHGCYWNGNDTAIDGCGSSVGYVEGTCDLGPIPTAMVGGTIMSYCHLVDGVGINFANGFGPQPAQRIIDHVESSSCLSPDCISVCSNDITSVDVTEVTTQSITLQINHRADEVNPGPWQIAYAPFGQTLTNWTYTTNANYTISGLNPNSYYNVGIRRACNETQITTVQQTTTITAGDWCSGNVTWYDTGGTSRDYPDGQRLVRLIKSEPGNTVTINFDEFETEQDYDYMYVYEGIGTEGTLIDAYSGTYTPGPFSISGGDALTFVFISDIYVTELGWKASISCTLSTQSNTFSNMSYYPNPVNNKLTINATEGISHIAIYNVAGQLLSENQTAITTNMVTDMSGYATGIYFVKVSNGRNNATLKIVKQ